MNLRPLASSLSAAAIASSLLFVSLPEANAQMTMRFTTPFVSDSGFVGASGDRHFINLAVTGFPLESVTIALPLDMGRSVQAKVVGRDGKEIPSTTKVAPGSITIDFSQPVKPDTYVTVQLSGVDMSRMGGSVLYRLNAKLEGIGDPIPVGSTMVRLRDQN
jgi:hypothetical protein